MVRGACKTFILDAITVLLLKINFQSEFQKLFYKQTPTKLLPDLLKNNYLDEPALTLVKSLENIDEI